VHVDFNCLFEKGMLRREWPETVPFRLTQNLVAAMGTAGVEGRFRKTCEATLRILRDHKEQLMCALEPFIHDPLQEWDPKRQPRGAVVPRVGPNEKRNPYAVVALQAIAKRLEGTTTRAADLPLSVAEQVDGLIGDAMSPDNLAPLYPGWAPYL
jgi:serine/threonine-protein kinase ATR